MKNLTYEDNFFSHMIPKAHFSISGCILILLSVFSPLMGNPLIDTVIIAEFKVSQKPFHQVIEQLGEKYKEANSSYPVFTFSFKEETLKNKLVSLNLKNQNFPNALFFLCSGAHAKYDVNMEALTIVFRSNDTSTSQPQVTQKSQHELWKNNIEMRQLLIAYREGPAELPLVVFAKQQIAQSKVFRSGTNNIDIIPNEFLALNLLSSQPGGMNELLALYPQSTDSGKLYIASILNQHQKLPEVEKRALSMRSKKIPFLSNGSDIIAIESIQNLFQHHILSGNLYKTINQLIQR